MKIRVDNIPEEGRQINAKIDPSKNDWDLPAGYGFAKTLTFAGRVRRSGEDLAVEGNLTGSIESQCSRCLGNFEMPVDMALDTVFTPRGEIEDEDVEVVEVDSGISFYDGISIDLDKEIRDLILINIPIGPVCWEDCKGLCSGCGADLNTVPCGCSSDGGPSPFDKLKELKAKLEE